MSNLAKDWQTGTYIVSVYNNRVKVSRPEQGYNEPLVEAEAKCDPEDEFSLSMGAALAMDRLSKKLGRNKIGVGDKVRIKNSSLVYDVYATWVIKNIHDITKVARYAYRSHPDTNYAYKVIAIAPHGLKNGENLAYIEEIDGAFSPCYLIGVDGLEKV